MNDKEINFKPKSPSHTHKQSNTSIDVDAKILGNQFHFFAKRETVVDKEKQDTPGASWFCWRNK